MIGTTIVSTIPNFSKSSDHPMDAKETQLSFSKATRKQSVVALFNYYCHDIELCSGEMKVAQSKPLHSGHAASRTIPESVTSFTRMFGSSICIHAKLSICS